MRASRPETGGDWTCVKPHDAVPWTPWPFHASSQALSPKATRPRSRMIDPALFDPSAVSEEIRAQNAEIVAKLSALPDVWSVPLPIVRERRRRGLGPFPPMPKSERAQTLAIAGPAGPIALRIIAPDNPRGVYLHIHG